MTSAKPLPEEAVTDALLPCPFCGDGEELRIEADNACACPCYWWVICGACSGRMIAEGRGNAVASWNTRAMRAATQPTAMPEAFQARVGKWMEQCFTPAIIADKLERSDRFIEEALELVQACDYSAERAHALVDYVFGRPVGEPSQEVGGVMVTLAALCNPHGLDMDEAAETELARIMAPKVIEKIRAKQASKPVGSALPIPTATTMPEEEVMRRALDALSYGTLSMTKRMVVIDFEDRNRAEAMFEALEALSTPIPLKPKVGERTRRLVIAARQVAFGGGSEEARRELDAASEAFAADVPWDDAP